MPRAPKPAKPTPKKPRKKPAPKPVKQDPALNGPRPMTKFDFDFCHLVVQTGKWAEAWRQLRPNDKDPYKAAHRMKLRSEITEHIKAIYRRLDQEREKAVEVSVRANLLSLELADDRLSEILQQPRKKLKHMLGRDTRSILGKGVTNIPLCDEDGNDTGKCSQEYSPEFMEELEGPAPAEDADLLKAIKLTYDRKQGIIKADKAAPPSHLNVMLYKPKWYGQGREPVDEPATIEGQANG